MFVGFQDFKEFIPVAICIGASVGFVYGVIQPIHSHKEILGHAQKTYDVALFQILNAMFCPILFPLLLFDMLISTCRLDFFGK